MFEWINRRLHCISSYSQFSQNNYASDEEDDKMRAAAAEEEEADTAAPLLHDMLNGILTLGTLSRHHPLISQAYGDGSDPDDDGFYKQGAAVRVAGTAAFFAAGREPLQSAFTIRLMAEEERRIMEVAVRANEASAEKKTLELPLLEKRRPPRTTLEELLAATKGEFLAGDGTAGSEKRKTATTVHVRRAKKSDGAEKKEKKQKQKRTNRGQQKDILIPKMLMEKKIHPELELEEKEKKREENPMAAHVAFDEVLLQLRGPN